MLYMIIHSDLMTTHKNFVNKIVKDINHYNLLEIQPTPFYLILTLWTYHLFLRHSILNIYHRAMNLYIQKGYL